jgi:NADH dehydrogenase FAD-containing subunit
MKRIVIIGAGFGGLAAAKALRHAKAEIWEATPSSTTLCCPGLISRAPP